MTARADRASRAVILPAADAASGKVASPWLVGDLRVAMPFGRDDSEPHLVAYWCRSVQCPSGRHLWDAIVVNSRENVPVVADDDVERRRLRMKPTCVRCGLIDDCRGVSEDHGTPRTAPVELVPLRAGRPLAHQVDGDRGGRRDLSSWAVHDDPDAAPIGFMAWGCGPRGGRHVTGRLYTWPDGVSVRAATPEACLAKLVKAPGGGPS